MAERSTCNVLLPEDLDYIASVIDRNGTISISINKNLGRHRGVIRIRMNDEDEANKLRSLIGTGHIYKYNLTKSYTTHKSTYTYCRLGIGMHAAYELLIQLKDRLVIQRNKADLYIRYVDMVRRLPRGLQCSINYLPDEGKNLVELLKNANDSKGKPIRSVLVKTLL